MLHEKTSAATLGAARILVYSLCLVNIHLLPLEEFASLPLAVQHQHGILRLLPDAAWSVLHQAASILALKAICTVGLAWLILGLRPYTRVAIATCIAITLFDGLSKGFGHITHSKMILLYAAWILAFFPATDGRSLRRDPPPARGAAAYSLPMVLITLLLLTSYCFVGIARLETSGVGVYVSDGLRTALLTRSLEPSPTQFRFGADVAESAPLMWIAQAGFVLVGVMELVAPLCLFHTRLRRVWLGIMLPFHVIVFFTMNIAFWENFVLLLFFAVSRGTAPTSRTGPIAPARTPSPT